MSRVEEALRRMQEAENAPDARYRGLTDVGGRDENKASPLDRYVVEGPARLRETERRPMPVVPAAPVAPVAPSTPLIDSRPVRSLPVSNEKLVASPEAESLLIEQHRRLGAALHDMQGQHGLKILMVSSAVQQEGKTLTISNLALTLSESFRRRVLLIDADLRRPAVHEVFGIPNDRGLTDMVRTGGATVPLIEVSPGLSILTAGRPEANPLSPLMSDRLGEVVGQASARFDWVLLDTPPIGLLPDAQLVARVSEGILFVIAAGLTDYSLVQRCINELGPERIVGTVLNRVDPNTLAGRHGYGRYYQRTPGAATTR